jgi:hypothetical protein
MGFLIKYNRFFSVTFLEEGSDSPLEKFSFFATTDTIQALQNHKLIFRPRSHGFDVFYSSTPMVPISEKIHFSFGFTTTDTGLFERYGLIKSGENDSTLFEPGLYFSNLDNNGTIITQNPASIAASGAGPEHRVTAADTSRFYRQTFKIIEKNSASVPDEYTLKHKYINSIQQTNPVDKPASAETIITTINSVDLEDDFISKPGPYLLEYGNNPTISRNHYLNSELGQKSVLGVIDIYWETPQNTISDAETGQQYNITFKPK